MLAAAVASTVSTVNEATSVNAPKAIVRRDSDGSAEAEILRVGDGSAELPSFSFISDPRTGLFLREPGSMVLATGGSERLSLLQNRVFVAGVRGVTTGAPNAIPVVIDSNGQLGTISSSGRYKFDVGDMGDTGALLRLRPVTFRYHAYGLDSPLQYGLIAEEVGKVAPELVVFNEEGQPETVMYQFLTPMLLNEVQKQRRVIDDLQSRLQRLEALVGAR